LLFFPRFLPSANHSFDGKIARAKKARKFKQGTNDKKEMGGGGGGGGGEEKILVIMPKIILIKRSG
jgi:hypothetical protein